MPLYLELFLAFFKIGIFGFGGGYAMLPLIQYEVVDHARSWLSITEFTDIVAISQMTPGPIAINSATYVGYRVTSSVLGSFIATFGVCLAPFVIMIVLSKFFLHFRSNKHFNNAMQAIKPAVIGLIAAAAISLMNKENFIDYRSTVIFVMVFIASFKGLNPISLIVAAGFSGWLVY